jgi:hypothetical protein
MGAGARGGSPRDEEGLRARAQLARAARGAPAWNAPEHAQPRRSHAAATPQPRRSHAAATPQPRRSVDAP